MEVAEIIEKEKFLQNSATVIWSTTNLLRKGLNTYDLPRINPFVPNAPFLYPLKISENRKVF